MGFVSDDFGLVGEKGRILTPKLLGLHDEMRERIDVGWGR